jgi:hypothetical protein
MCKTVGGTGTLLSPRRICVGTSLLWLTNFRWNVASDVFKEVIRSLEVVRDAIRSNDSEMALDAANRGFVRA